MSEKAVSGSTTVWRDYILAGGRIVAQKSSGAVANTRYILADHLGSSTVVMDESGNVVERNAYDPWGKRRNISGTDDPACSLTSLTSRGFTGHEHIDAECLINMNARIYDPALGRFMTADSVVSDPLSSQGFNRYAYVNNGPLSATDPTGHDCFGVGPNTWICYNVDVSHSSGSSGDKYVSTASNVVTITFPEPLVIPKIDVTPPAYRDSSQKGGNGAGQGGEKNKVTNKVTGQCNRTGLAIGNFLRSGAHRLNQLSTLGLGRGVYAALAGAPGIPETAGASEIPAGALVTVSLAGYKVAGAMDVLGGMFQTGATGNPNYQNEAVMNWYGGDQVAQALGPLGWAANVVPGVVDALGAAPADAVCPVNK